MRCLLLFLATLAFAQERIVESIVPALAYGPTCSSTLELRNLSDREASVDVEGHRASGALVALAGHAGMSVHLAAHEAWNSKLDVAEQTTGAWVKVRERVPRAELSPAVAVTASTECIVANQLRTVRRDVAFPTRSPWFASDVANLRGGVIALINTSERAATASACYSSGSQYAMPGAGRGVEWQPVCATAFDVQIPPFGTREFPVSREGSSYFTLKTSGDAIVLEMLRPLEANVRVYTVDSSIEFGKEVKK